MHYVSKANHIFILIQYSPQMRDSFGHIREYVPLISSPIFPHRATLHYVPGLPKFKLVFLQNWALGTTALSSEPVTIS